MEITDAAVSADGKIYLYDVAPTAVTSGTDETNINVDTTGTKPQLYVLNTNTVGATPQKINTSIDNKANFNFVSSTEYEYLSSNPDDEGTNGKKGIYSIGLNKYTTTKVAAVADNVTKLYISPDGTKIAAESTTSNGAAVSVLSGSNLTNITR